MKKRLDQIASRTLIMINSYLIDFTTTFADCVMIAVSQIFSLIKFQSGLHKGWAIGSVYKQNYITVFIKLQSVE